MKCMHNLFSFIVLNVRDGTEFKYPSIVFLSIGMIKFITCWSHDCLYLLVSSADNLCKQFGPRSGPTKSSITFKGMHQIHLKFTEG